MVAPYETASVAKCLLHYEQCLPFEMMIERNFDHFWK